MTWDNPRAYQPPLLHQSWLWRLDVYHAITPPPIAPPRGHQQIPPRLLDEVTVYTTPLSNSVLGNTNIDILMMTEGCCTMESTVLKPSTPHLAPWISIEQPPSLAEFQYRWKAPSIVSQQTSACRNRRGLTINCLFRRAAPTTSRTVGHWEEKRPNQTSLLALIHLRAVFPCGACCDDSMFGISHTQRPRLIEWIPVGKITHRCDFHVPTLKNSSGTKLSPPRVTTEAKR